MATETKKSKRDFKVEFIRVLCSFLVVCYHIKNPYYRTDGNVSTITLAVETFCSIQVISFFIIGGFFNYNKKSGILESYKEILIYSIKRVIIPFILVLAICIIFNDFFIGYRSFLYCIINLDVKDLFNKLYLTIITYSVNHIPGSAAHLWYIFHYIFIIICYPLIRLFVKKTNKIIKYGVLIIIGLLLLYSDICIYYNNYIPSMLFNFLPMPVFYSAVGYVLYNDIIKKYIIDRESSVTENKFFINKKITIISAIGYLISFILLYYIQYCYYTYVRGEYTYTSWMSFFSFTESCFAILFIYNINFDKFLKENIKKFILNLSSLTLGIYLVHYLIVVYFNAILIQKFFQSFLFNPICHLLYYIIYGGLIFMFSAIITIIYKKVTKFLGGIALCQREKTI